MNMTMNRRPDIQGLRAIAVLMVVAFHAGLPVPGGFVGVDVFFVISGFVIFGVLEREWAYSNRVRLARFYIRRFKRLMPALALVVAATLIASVFILSPLGPQQNAAQTGFGAMLFAANLVIAKNTGGYFGAAADENPLLHTWSLSVEEQFYLVFPVLIALSWYFARKTPKFRILPCLVVTAIAVISFCFAIFGTSIIHLAGLPTSFVTGTFARETGALLGFYSPLTRSWEFSAGVLLAMALKRWNLHSRSASTILSILGISMLVTSLWIISDRTPFPSAWTLLPVTGTLLLLSGGVVDGTLLTRALSTTPFVRVGDWSYSIYLWHWPFIVFAGLLSGHSKGWIASSAAMSLLPAIISYYRLELPIRNLESIDGKSLLRIAAVTLVSPLLVCGSVTYATGRGYWSNGVRSMQTAVLADHASSTYRCSVGNLSSGPPDPSCIFNPGGGSAPIYLIGDSTAWHFTEAAAGAADALGSKLTVVNTPAACPFKNVYSFSHSVPEDRNSGKCRLAYETAIEWLENQDPGLVLISELNGYYQSKDISFGLVPDEFETNVADKDRVLTEGLVSTIRTLEAAGHRIVLIQAAPYFAYPSPFNPLKCDLRKLRSNNCVARMPRVIADSIQGSARSSLATAAAGTSALLWDPRDFFCPDEECTTQIGGLNLYRDAFHITPAASRMLAPSLTAAIAGKL